MQRYVRTNGEHYPVTATPLNYEDYLTHRAELHGHECPTVPKYLARRRGYLVVDKLLVERGLGCRTAPYDGEVYWENKSAFEACWRPE